MVAIAAPVSGFDLPPVPVSTPDQICQNRIEGLLRDQPHRELQEIQISSDRGTITMQGRVSSFYLRQLCIRCCQQAAGVLQINDQLQVGTA